MTNFTYPQNRTPAGELSALFVYTDIGCTAPATITDTSGNPIPGSRVAVGPDGQWPLFQCTSSVLYTPSPDGSISTLNPTLNYGNPAAVTGSRGANAALASLITALVNAGVPITDSTTA